MSFLTDRKRAAGMGAAKTGTGNFWGMTISSVALLALVPLFIFMIGPLFSQDYATVSLSLQNRFLHLFVYSPLLLGCCTLKMVSSF